METQAIVGDSTDDLDRSATQAVVELAVEYGDRATERAIADISPNGHYVAGAGASLIGSATGILIGIPSKTEAFLGFGGGIVGAIAGFLILKIIVRRK